jgi:FkbM family methyltransferase
MSRMSRSLGLIGVIAVAFVAGFLTHRADGHRLLQPAVAYAVGEAGGCSLPQTYRALSDELTTTKQALREGAKILEERDGLRLWQYRDGQIWAPASSSVDWAYVLAEQELNTYGDGEFAVRRDEVVLDAGANIGTFTRHALDRGARLVVAIEPVPSNVESLRRNFASEIQAGRVVVVPKGVWNKDDVLEMNLFENSALDSFTMSKREEAPGEEPQKVRLPLTTIDKIVAELKLPRIDFLKMDIEGAEKQALEGARATIRQSRPRMALATENDPEDHVRIPEVVKGIDAGYSWTCGPTVMNGPLLFRPLVLYFQI